jgi:hypothetical protein
MMFHATGVPNGIEASTVGFPSDLIAKLESGYSFFILPFA